MSDYLHNWDIETKLAVQMYTVREQTKTEKDLAETLEKIAKIGYTAVQLSAVGAMNGEAPLVSATLARKLLDDNGLRCIATHRDWTALTKKTESEIEFHQKLGCDYVAIGSIPGEYAHGGVDGYRQWAMEAIELSHRLAIGGISFGYHNHAFEFEKVGAKRMSLFDELAKASGPTVFLELDIYWAQDAGLDPVKLIRQHPGRLPVVHLKDKEVIAGNSVMAPVGEGNLDWSRIIPALKTAGTEWYCVEQDECFRDPFDCLKSSYNYLR